MPIISGNVGAVFNGGTITRPLNVDLSGSDGSTVPVSVEASLNEQSTDVFSVTNADVGGGPLLEIDAGGNFIVSNGFGNARIVTSSIQIGVNLPLAANEVVLAAKGVATEVVTSGALPTVSPASGTAFQCSTTRDVFLVVPFTLTTAAGTCKVEISPDNLTFSTLVTLTPAVNASVSAASVHVPAAWRVKLTVTNATLGTGTYY